MFMNELIDDFIFGFVDIGCGFSLDDFVLINYCNVVCDFLGVCYVMSDG